MEGLPFFCTKPPMTSILHGPTGSYYETGIIRSIIAEENPKKLHRLLQKYRNIDRERVGDYLEYAIYYKNYKTVPLLAKLRNKESIKRIAGDCITKPDLTALELILSARNSQPLYHYVMLLAPKLVLETSFFTPDNKESLLQYLIDNDPEHPLVMQLIDIGIPPPSILGTAISHIPIMSRIIEQRLPFRPWYITNLAPIIPLRYISRKIWSELMVRLSDNSILFTIHLDAKFSYPVTTLTQALAYVDMLSIPPYAPGSREWKETKDHFELTTGKLSEKDNKLGYPELIVRANYYLSRLTGINSKLVDKESIEQRIPQLSKSDLLKIIYQD